MKYKGPYLTNRDCYKTFSYKVRTFIIYDIRLTPFLQLGYSDIQLRHVVRAK